MGFHPNNKSEGKSISEHVREKRKTKDDRDGLEHEHYGYRKIWRYTPDDETKSQLHKQLEETWDELPTVLDATAGGGTIPLESIRYGLPTIANELNPVPSVVLEAVLKKTRTQSDVSEDIIEWGEEIDKRSREALSTYYPEDPGERNQSYLWAHRVSCLDCGLKVPLASSWWINKGSSSREGQAARPIISDQRDTVEFEIVDLPEDVTKDEFNPTDGTISYSKMTCPRCGVTMDSDTLKSMLQEGEYDYQLYAIYYDKENERGHEFRTPHEEDIKAYEEACEAVENSVDLSTLLAVDIPSGEKTDELHRNGMEEWRDLFTPRQLLTHYTYWEKFEEVKSEIRAQYNEEEADTILTYLSLVADKALDYNSRMSSWDPGQPQIRNMYAGSDFAFSWSFQEHNLIMEGHGYDWMLTNIAEDVYSGVREQLKDSKAPAEVYQGDAADLQIEDESVDAVVLDPPYYGMIMYAELSDYFYVWMRKYLEDVYPDFFTSELTEKNEEAVANTSKFEGVNIKGRSKKDLAREEYENKMTDIFEHLHRVMAEDAIFTMMFTHKETEAWDTLTKALIESGFVVTSTHPISTENQFRVQQSGRNSADSTILLASEKRKQESSASTLWGDVQKQTRQAAEKRVRELEQEEAEFTKVDMMLAAFGPTLEIFTQEYPVVDDEGNEVSPQVALDEARAAVRDYLIDKYLNEGVREVDSKSEWYLLAWLMFEAKRFPYDEGRRLAIGVGENVDELKKQHRFWRTRSGDIVLRPHEDRVRDVNKPKENRSGRKPIAPESLSYNLSLDKVHAALHIYNIKGETEAWNWLKDRNCGSDPAFKATLEGLLRVLPHDHEDWEIARDIAAGETGDLLDLDLDADIFQEKSESDKQGRLADF
jgi:adenine-specific DNA methylase